MRYRAPASHIECVDHARITRSKLDVVMRRVGERANNHRVGLQPRAIVVEIHSCRRVRVHKYGRPPVLPEAKACMSHEFELYKHRLLSA